MQDSVLSFPSFEGKVIELRGQLVILDRDIAEIFNVETREVNQAVKNNPDKFPEGYVFELQVPEKQEVVENFPHLELLKFSPVTPKAFTEKGLYMLTTCLKSERATQVTLTIIESFVKLKELSRILSLAIKERDKAI